MARIRALARRPKTLTEHKSLSFLDISFDPDARMLSCKGNELRLSGREALLLEFFLKNPAKTLAREQIFYRVWGPDGMVEDGNLDLYLFSQKASAKLKKPHRHPNRPRSRLLFGGFPCFLNFKKN